MPKLYVTYQNHLDLSWRRPRYSAGNTEGWKITPYSELQERQLDRAFDFIREGGCYSLEQTISLREYLDRNPDCFDEVREWIRDGRLAVLGGGESVIDYNLPDGESIVRNHLYSRLWLKNEFGYAPSLADCPDTFGLSANLPDLFRQLGYKGMLEFNRVFQNSKPYWRGISGDVIALDTIHSGIHSAFFGGFLKCRVCTICGGDGCPACEGSGMMLDEHPKDFTAMHALKEHLLASQDDFRIVFGGEESMASEHVTDVLRVLAEETGRELIFTSTEALSLLHGQKLLDHVDDAAENDIDVRTEGNPVATGCYTTRIKLKQENRRCESALRTAERLAAAASLEGLPYPAKTFELYWRKLAYIQFHDALPASHSDDVYTELMELGRQMRAALSRITNRSIKKLLEKAAVEDGEGIPFAVVNPLEFDVHNAKLSGVVRCGRYTEGGKIIAPDGTEYPVLSVRCTDTAGYDEAMVDFVGSLPAFGYKILRFVPDETEAAEPKHMKHGCVMENDYLRVTFSDHAVREVFDKVNNRVLAGEGSFAPWLSDDAGHPWGRTNTIQYEERADEGTYWENMLPAKERSQKVTYEKKDGVQIVRIHVRYARLEKQINALDWCAEFMLADTSRELDVTIRTSFDARDIRLSTHVVLEKAPKDSMLDFEIPLGMIRRGRTEDFNAQLGYADDWAALRYVSADMVDYRVTLCNNGTPAHTIHRSYGNHITIALLRTPTQLCCGFGIENAIDTSEHVFRFTLASDTDPMDAYRRGMTLNTDFPTVSVKAKEGLLPAEHSFMRLPDNLPLLALKGAEDRNGFIVRYVGIGEERTLRFSTPALPANPLEETVAHAVTEAVINPYRISTFRITADALKI